MTGGTLVPCRPRPDAVRIHRKRAPAPSGDGAYPPRPLPVTAERPLPSVSPVVMHVPRPPARLGAPHRRSAPARTARAAGARASRLWLALLALLLALVAPGRAEAQDRSVPAAQSAGEVARGAPVGLGDKVVLKVWREPTWSDAFLVDEAGEVVLPRIGRLRVLGMHPEALEDTVRERLAAYLREPNVDVIVLRRVVVLGAVRKPDVLFIEPVTTLADVIAQAGGLTEDGNPDRIEIVRDGARRAVGRWRDVAGLAAQVRSGDQVVVHQRGWLSRNALAALSSVAVAASVLLSALAR